MRMLIIEFLLAARGGSPSFSAKGRPRFGKGIERWPADKKEGDPTGRLLTTEERALC